MMSIVERMTADELVAALKHHMADEKDNFTRGYQSLASDNAKAIRQIGRELVRRYR